MHAKKFDVKQGVDPYPLLARSCDRWWPDFVTFTACKRSIFGLKRGKKAQCVSNRCKDLVKRKKYFGIMRTIKPFVFQKKHTETRHNKLFTCAKTFNRVFMAVDRDRITSRLIYEKIFCTTLFWCSVKRPSVTSVGRILDTLFFSQDNCLLIS